jgi:predicted transcriptional regulator
MLFHKEVKILETVGDNKNVPILRISEISGVNYSYIVKVLKIFQEGGLILVKDLSARSKTASLTKKGETINLLYLKIKTILKDKKVIELKVPKKGKK